MNVKDKFYESRRDIGNKAAHSSGSTKDGDIAGDNNAVDIDADEEINLEASNKISHETMLSITFENDQNHTSRTIQSSARFTVNDTDELLTPMKRKQAAKDQLHWKREEQMTRYKRQLQQEERELRSQRRKRQSLLPQKSSILDPENARTPPSLPQKRVTFSSP